MARRPKQAGFVSLNLRLPPELHKTLVKAAGAASSLNSEIVRRLQGSLDADANREAAEQVTKMLADQKIGKRLRKEIVKLLQEVLAENERGGEAS
jgi:hypothetical protein